jgi:D-alanyl-D-alanine carboxypeptidase/D-alanyl-D-alanine-endopeptidase (penicillin-binding protein 4)
VRGDLFLVGGGDPTLDASDLSSLAGKLAAAGIRRVAGNVVGDTGAFDRGWWAPGWLPRISRSYVARPVALRLDTSATGLEASAAAAFRDALVAAGIRVDGTAVAGRSPVHLRALGAVTSPPLRDLLFHQNHESDNLYAELLTKALGEHAYGEGSTAAGARAIRRWAADHGVRSDVRDGSGLSDLDRTSAAGVVSLLLRARREPWFGAFFRSLAPGGDGTLDGRLAGVPVRAKTGTLFVRPTSTLSGYVTDASGATVAFSVLTRGLPSSVAEPIEDAVVRTLAAARVADAR